MKFLKLTFIALSMAVSLPSFAQFTTGGKASNSNNSSTDSYLSSGYKGFVELGYGVGVGDLSAGRVEFSTTHGYQVCPYFFAGVGVGVNYFHEGSSVNVPIFADFHGTLPIQSTRIAPFLDMKIGYSAVDVAGFYFSPSVGMRFAIGNKSGFNIGIGYELQKCDAYYYSYVYDYLYEDTATAGAFTIKLGFDF